MGERKDGRMLDAAKGHQVFNRMSKKRKRKRRDNYGKACLYAEFGGELWGDCHFGFSFVFVCFLFAQVTQATPFTIWEKSLRPSLKNEEAMLFSIDFMGYKRWMFWNVKENMAMKWSYLLRLCFFHTRDFWHINNSIQIPAFVLMSFYKTQNKMPTAKRFKALQQLLSNPSQ